MYPMFIAQAKCGDYVVFEEAHAVVHYVGQIIKTEIISDDDTLYYLHHIAVVNNDISNEERDLFACADPKLEGIHTIFSVLDIEITFTDLPGELYVLIERARLAACNMEFGTAIDLLRETMTVTAYHGSEIRGAITGLDDICYQSVDQSEKTRRVNLVFDYLNRFTNY